MVSATGFLLTTACETEWEAGTETGIEAGSEAGGETGFKACGIDDWREEFEGFAPTLKLVIN